jgi:hypothetical protein
VVHLVHVSTLSGWVLPYPAGYGFPLPFGRWHSLLGPSCSRWRIPPPSRLAYCWIMIRQTPSGFPRSALLRCDWRGCPLYSGVSGVRTLELCASSSGCDPSSTRQPSCVDLSSRSLIEGSLAFIRPVFPVPGSLSDGSRDSLGVCPLASDPAVTSDARRGGNRLGHEPGYFV